MTNIFVFADYWWFYLAFVIFVLLVLLLDLGVFHKEAHVVGFKEASVWTAVWITLALVFNALFYYYVLWKFQNNPALAMQLGLSPEDGAKQYALEFLTGYIVEKSLSVDNIFVFIIVFSYFGIPAKYQHRVLFYGILGALIFRAIFIAIGSYLMAYHAVVIFFGLFLIFTGLKMFFADESEVHPEKNIFLKLLQKIIPVTPRLHEDHFFIKENGRTFATPLLVTLVVLEATDVIFAVDSVPAIFALTKEPLIVFTSNIFAILGLRAMYFMLSGMVGKFYLLKFGLASVLVFVGLKMAWLNEAFGGKFPIGISLGIIALLIGGSIVISLIFPKKEGPIIK